MATRERSPDPGKVYRAVRLGPQDDQLGTLRSGLRVVGGRGVWGRHAQGGNSRDSVRYLLFCRAMTMTWFRPLASWMFLGVRARVFLGVLGPEDAKSCASRGGRSSVGCRLSCLAMVAAIGLRGGTAQGACEPDSLSLRLAEVSTRIESERESGGTAAAPDPVLLQRELVRIRRLQSRGAFDRACSRLERLQWRLERSESRAVGRRKARTESVRRLDDALGRAWDACGSVDAPGAESGIAVSDAGGVRRRGAPGPRGPHGGRAELEGRSRALGLELPIAETLRLMVRRRQRAVSGGSSAVSMRIRVFEATEESLALAAIEACDGPVAVGHLRALGWVERAAELRPSLEGDSGENLEPAEGRGAVAAGGVLIEDLLAMAEISRGQGDPAGAYEADLMALALVRAPVLVSGTAPVAGALRRGRGGKSESQRVSGRRGPRRSGLGEPDERLEKMLEGLAPFAWSNRRHAALFEKATRALEGSRRLRELGQEEDARRRVGEGLRVALRLAAESRPAREDSRLVATQARIEVRLGMHPDAAALALLRESRHWRALALEARVNQDSVRSVQCRETAETMAEQALALTQAFAPVDSSRARVRPLSGPEDP